MIDNSEMEEILEKLESLEDEELAARLLKEFNEKKKHWGQLLMNLDPNLDHQEWKDQCDEAKKEVDAVVQKIRSL